MSLIGSNLPRQRLGNFDAQTGSLVLDEHFRDPGSTHRGVSMDVKSWPHGFHSDTFPHGAVSSRSLAPNSRLVGLSVKFVPEPR